MPPAAVIKEKEPYFLKGQGRDAAQVRRNSEILRGADPLIVMPSRCKGLGWLQTVLPDLGRTQDVGGRTMEGFRYSDLEFIFGALVCIPEVCKDKAFKDVMFSPTFLYRVGAYL